MAFSSLKEVLHVGFMNEQEGARCPLSSGGLKLKQYNSSADFRSWALDKKEQSHFVADLVACRVYGDDVPTAGGDSRAIRSGQGQASQYKGLTPDYEKDSLVELAKMKLTNIDDLIAKNKILQSQLDMSQENLDIVKDENIKIKGIVASGIDLQPLTPFQNKIKELKSSGKISDLDEKQLLDLQKQFGKRDKAYEVLEAENASLRRLAEKLSHRANFDKLPLGPETGTEVKVLQDKVNRLSKEVAILRGVEEEFLRNKIKKGGDTKNNIESEKLNKLIQERNSLKEKLEKLNGLEARILALMKKADEASRLEKENATLKQQIARCSQSVPLPPPQNDNKSSGNYDALKAENARLKDLLDKLKNSEGCLRNSIEKYKAQNLELQERIQDAELELKKLDTLHQELCLARSMIQRKESMLRQYECQLYQMKDIIEELSNGRQACEIKNLSDECTQTQDDHLDDLEWATRETLNQIKCEIEARGCLEKQLQEVKVQSADQINDLKETNQNLKDNLDQTEAECCSKVSKLMNELEAAKKKENDLLKQLSDSENSNKNEKRKSVDLSNAKDGLQGEIGKLHDELGKLKGDLKAKDNEINSLNSKISDLEDQLRKCLADKTSGGKDDGELDRLRKQLQDLQNKLDEEIKKSQACEEQSKDLKARLEAAEKAKQEAERAKQEAENAKQEAENKKAEAPQPPPPAQTPIEPQPSAQLEVAEPPVQEAVEEPIQKPSTTAPAAAGSPSTPKPAAAAGPPKQPDAPKSAAAPPPPPTTGKETPATAKPEETKPPGKAAPKTTPRQIKKPCKKPCKMPEKKDSENKDDAEKYKCKHLERNRSSYGYVCDQKMADSLLNISQQISDLCHSDDIERDVTKILNNLKDDLSSCQKYMKGFATKLETICQKIIDKGIDCLNIHDLIYLHREVYNAGMKLNPEAINTIMDEEIKCCKCKKFACCLPEYPKKNEKKLFMQITNLQTQIDSIGPDITKLAAQNKMKFLTNLTYFLQHLLVPAGVAHPITPLRTTVPLVSFAAGKGIRFQIEYMDESFFEAKT